MADVENNVKCTPGTVMKIASISKPITMAVTAKIIESGLLDVDADIKKYVRYWPDKTWNGKKVGVCFKINI